MLPESHKRIFTLWLEYNPLGKADPDLSEWDLENEFMNIGVDLKDGRYYGINVWTFQYFKTTIEENQKDKENLNGIYVTPPDLFVKDLSKDCIEATINDLLAKGELEWLLNPTVFNVKYLFPWIDIMELEDQGEVLKKMLREEMTPGHYLYNKEFSVEAKRPDTGEVAVKLKNGSIAILDLNSTQMKNEFDLSTRLYCNEMEFWKLRLKDDIARYKENENHLKQ